jgi:hypothetical protein
MSHEITSLHAVPLGTSASVLSDLQQNCNHEVMTSLHDLQAHRIARGVSLQQIARATMITTRYLEAIERGAFDKLPGGVYTTSYIRQYARSIGWDECALIDYYREVSATPQSD